MTNPIQENNTPPLLSEFLPSEQERSALLELKHELNMYMLQKTAIAAKQSENTLIDLQEYFSCTRATHTEKSNVFYHNILDSKADSKDTLKPLLHDLYEEFIVRRGMHNKYLVVEGDAKIYELLQSLKLEYSNELGWLIPYPGDWHMLMNYQVALMKPYFDAGLHQLAEAAGYPVASIRACGQFKKTHHFITEAWEAMYRAMLSAFMGREEGRQEDLLSRVFDILNNTKDSTEGNFKDTMNTSIGTLSKQTETFFSEFDEFIQEMTAKDDTWKFWSQFVFVDAMAYISLYLAMRSGDWDLRMTSMKTMAPLFTAFDHTTYQKLISNHVYDLLNLPQAVLLMFTQGAFVVNISGREWHSVGIDEAHEMLINRQCKNAVVRPSGDYINRTASYLIYRSIQFEHLKKELFPETKQPIQTVTSIYSTKVMDKKIEANILTQIDAISKASLLEVKEDNRGLINPFTGEKAKDVKHQHLLNFRNIGETEYKMRIAFFILQTPSTNAPNRRRALQTFSTKQPTKKRVSQLERDQKLILTAIKRKIHFAQKTGQPVDRPGEQLAQYPLSLCDSDGNPRSGQKSYFTRSLENRYKKCSPPILTHRLPTGWKPQCSLLEGMFLINTYPLSSHKTLGAYSSFLLERFILPQFHKGSHEVHVVFDNPGRLQNTPKFFEQKRRDATQLVPRDHICREFKEGLEVAPKNWRESTLNCRTCKRNLVMFLGNYFLHKSSSHLRGSQTLYVSGAFSGKIEDTAWYVNYKNEPEPDPNYHCNAEEADSRLWLHARKTKYSRILVITPDTDVYMVGLGLPCARSKEIVAQINPYHTRELRLLHLNRLITALETDPDLGKVESDLPRILQAIYVATGCDYTSFFSRIGKSTFLRYFYQYASFITGGTDTSTTPGSLGTNKFQVTNWEQGYLAFLRLVGTVYFKKYCSGFSIRCPEQHYVTFNHLGLSAKEQHHRWLDDIRETIWFRTQFENEMMASNESLKLHWMRSCWILHMWEQADRNKIILQPISEYGWNITNGTLTMKWDTDDNIKTIKDRLHTLTTGCKCATGCATKRCSCKKKGITCSAGCECINCCNIPPQSTSTSTSTDDVSNSDRDSALCDLCVEEERSEIFYAEVEDIMDFVFESVVDLEDRNDTTTDSDVEEDTE